MKWGLLTYSYCLVQNISALNSNIWNELSVTENPIPAGVRHAYVVITQLTNYQSHVITISGDIVIEQKKIKQSTVSLAGVGNAHTHIYVLSLSGDAGSINIRFTGGSGSNGNAYLILI